MQLATFYSQDPTWHKKIHSSTAIEGNRLTLGQVTDLINGKPVLGPPKDIDIATETASNVPVNVPVNRISDQILILLRTNPDATARKMALALDVTDKTIKRHIKTLREKGRLKRFGSDKTGHWEVIEEML